MFDVATITTISLVTEQDVTVCGSLLNVGPTDGRHARWIVWFEETRAVMTTSARAKLHDERLALEYSICWRAAWRAESSRQEHQTCDNHVKVSLWSN